MQNLINSYLGDHLLTDFLGAGGMGEVYLGIHEKIKRKVAIKILTCFEPGSNYNRRFLIDTIDGRADVYERNEYIGKTPYIKHAPTGSEIKIRLKRNGYQDKVIQFEVGEIDSQYSYSLNKASP